MAITTAMCTSFKQELFSAGHCFNQTVSPTFTVASNSASVTTVSSMSGVAVGMAFSCATAGVPANTLVLAITGSNAFTMSAVSTAAITGGTATIAGDVFKIALIKQGMSGTYTSTNVNYTDIGGNSDEVANTNGYTTGGVTLTQVTATTVGTVAFVSFANPQWTSATFSTAGCMIYNSSIRNGSTSGTNSTGGGRACSVHDFGGSQQVSSGTFTVLMPTANSTSAILRVA
jgi:hypothetical protein